MNETFDLDEIQVSRIVHFVIPSGKCRPGLVLEDWPDSGKPGYVNLAVYPDGSNDGKYGVDDHRHYHNGEHTERANTPLLARWETSVLPNHSVKAVRSWHWGRECKKLHKPKEPFTHFDTKEIYHHNHTDGMVDSHNCNGCIAEARYIKENIPTS